jgi:tetratricopeptide (TPR) repeat protein
VAEESHKGAARERLEAQLRDLLALSARQENLIDGLRQALREARGARQIRPDLLSRLESAVAAFAKTCMAVGETYGELGQWAEGAAWARKVLALAWDEESRADASLMLAVMLERSGWYGEAFEAFRFALEQGLDDVRLAAGANVGAANSLLELGRAKDAEIFCHAALGLRPNDPTAIFTLTRCLLLQGQWEPAVRCLIDACEAGIAGSELQLYGLMDHFQSIPDADVYMPEVKALFDGFREKAARRASQRRSDA